jgi:O-antigen ligase/tetratricopeptide (TPR) repeat protein
MPSDTSREFLVDDSATARRTSAALALAAAVVLFGNCLITSPSGFSAQHQQDTSLLKPVVTILGLNAAFPTTRGVEIRNLISYLGAAALALIAAFRVAATDRRPNLSFDDLLDFRRRAANPYFWWFLLLLASVLTSVFSHAPEVCEGQVIIRFLHLAWWLPLAALLAPRHVGKLAGALVAALGIMAGLGVWYYVRRQVHGSELIYPIGNSLWEGACLLPGVFIAIGLLVGGLLQTAPPPPACPAAESPTEPAAQPSAKSGSCSKFRWIGLLAALVVIAVALAFTRSRSAGVGLLAGAFAMACFLTVRVARRAVLLGALVTALAGAVVMQQVRTRGGMGQEAHSIRVRLNYAWPYALMLFFDKPVLGQGDGAYALLAGRYARDDQIEDPNTISFDEWSWFGRPDNEYLQMLSEIGLVGTLAFCIAIVLTIRRALRYCDRTRGDPLERGRRWLAVGMTAALIAIVFEEGTSPALREPGLPPIFLAVWAMVWALVRTEGPAHRRDAGATAAEPLPEERRLGRSFIRLSGVAVGVGAVILGYFAVQDWRGARASHEASMCIRSQDYAAGIPKAEFAGEHLLDPLRKMIARLYGIEARTAQFAGLAAQADQPLAPADIDLARQTLARLAKLDAAAPRFLKAARLRAEVWRNLAWAHSRAHETSNELDALKQFALACLQHRADEPFNTATVQDVWNVLYLVAAKWERLGGRPEDVQDVFGFAQTRQRLDWLRCLLRAGEIAPPFYALFEDLRRRPDFDAAMQHLLNAALAEAEVSPAQWQDRLAPETLRLVALSTALAGYPEDACKLTEKAAGLYEKAGPRLFSAHAAALDEWVRYDFSVDPTAHTDENLQRLARAHVILGGLPGVDQPLPGLLGETRLGVLLAAGREAEAENQNAYLHANNASWSSRSLAQEQLAVARAFGNQAKEIDRALTWAKRAADLAPDLIEAHALGLRLALQKADEAVAIEAARRLLECAPESDREGVYGYLAGLESRYSSSTIWAVLHRDYPDLPPPAPPTSQAAGAPTSAEAAPASTAAPTALPTSAPGG